MKKLLAIVLCLVLVLSMAVPALASDVPEATEEEVIADETIFFDYAITPEDMVIAYATIPEDAYEGVIVMRPDLESIMVPESVVVESSAGMPMWLSLVIVILLCILIGLVALTIPILLIILIVVLVRGKKKKAVVTEVQAAEVPEEIQEKQE